MPSAMLDFRVQRMSKTLTTVLVAVTTAGIASIAIAQSSPASGSADTGRREVSRSEARFTKAIVIKLANGSEQTYFPPREGSQGQITLRAEEANEKGRTLREFVALKGERPELNGKIYGDLTIFSISETSPNRRENIRGYFPKNNFLDIPPAADIFYHVVFEGRDRKVVVDRLTELPRF